MAWTRTFDGGGDDEGFDVAVDSEDNVLVVGSTESGNDTNAFIGKWDAGGAFQWSQQHDLNSTADSFVQAVAVDINSQGQIVAALSTSNAALIRYDGEGNRVSFPTGSGLTNIGGLAVDDNDHVVVVGYESVSGESNNIWLRRYNSDLTLLWTRGYDRAGGSDQGLAVAVDAELDVHVAGASTASTNEQTFFLGVWSP